MRYDPIDEDSRGDSPANKWSVQLDEQREIGLEIDERRHGEIINE